MRWIIQQSAQPSAPKTYSWIIPPKNANLSVMMAMLNQLQGFVLSDVLEILKLLLILALELVCTSARQKIKISMLITQPICVLLLMLAPDLKGSSQIQSLEIVWLGALKDSTQKMTHGPAQIIVRMALLIT